MNCDICGAEFANSEELKAHMEREHAPNERDDAELEAPDLIPEEEKAEQSS